MKKYISFLCVLSIVLTLCSPNICNVGIKNGIQICLYTILPSFFPFLVITNIMIKYNLFNHISFFTYPVMKKIFAISKNGSFVILIGFTCGYPIGLKTAYDMYTKGHITRDELIYLIKFCNNPSLPFVINYVGYNILNNQYDTWKLLLCIYGSSILTGILFGIKRSTYNLHTENTQNSFLEKNESVFVSTFKTLLILSSYVLLFSIAITYIQHLFPKNTLAKTILITLTEITSGLSYISGFKDISNYVPLIILALVSGGLSITTQSISFFKERKLIHHYLLGKLITVIISILIYIAT